MKKFDRLGQIVPEEILCQKLKLPFPNKTKLNEKPKSRAISELTRQGLKFGEIGGRRYFFESDIVQFFANKVFKIRE